MTHKKGEIITITGITIGGKKVEEGKAELIEPMTPSGMDNGQMWKVHFLKDDPDEFYFRWLSE
jgi:hypothetical protein